MPAEGEAVQVGVGPVEGDLEHLMDDVQWEVGAQVESPPDRRLGVFKVDPDPVDGDVVARWSPQLGSRLAAGDLAADQGEVAGELPQVREFHPGGRGFKLPEQVSPSLVVP